MLEMTETDSDETMNDKSFFITNTELKTEKLVFYTETRDENSRISCEM